MECPANTKTASNVFTLDIKSLSGGLIAEMYFYYSWMNGNITWPQVYIYGHRDKIT